MLRARIPPSDGALRMFDQQFGHAATLAADRIPKPLWEWQMALMRHTDNQRNEYAQNVALASF